MPRAGVERAVEIRDEVVLGEVEFDVAEDVREEERPELLRRQRALALLRFGSLSRGCFPGFTPSRREDVLGIEP